MMRAVRRKTINVFMIFSIFIVLLSSFSMADTASAKVKKNGVYNLDKASVKDLDKAVLRGTPLKLDNKLRLKDIKKVWGKPDEHIDMEEYQLYIYTKKKQTFTIYVDEMNEISKLRVELNYKKSEILKLMGKKPTMNGHIITYEKRGHVIQFEKFSKKGKWNLILYRK